MGVSQSIVEFFQKDPNARADGLSLKKPTEELLSLLLVGKMFSTRKAALQYFDLGFIVHAAGVNGRVGFSPDLSTPHEDKYDQ